MDLFAQEPVASSTSAMSMSPRTSYHYWPCRNRRRAFSRIRAAALPSERYTSPTDRLEAAIGTGAHLLPSFELPSAHRPPIACRPSRKRIHLSVHCGNMSAPLRLPLSTRLSVCRVHGVRAASIFG